MLRDQVYVWTGAAGLKSTLVTVSWCCPTSTANWDRATGQVLGTSVPSLTTSPLCDPKDCSPPGSSVQGVLQARILELGCHFLLQWIFLIQGLNPCILCLLHWEEGSLPLAPPGKPQARCSVQFSHSVVSDSLRPHEPQHGRPPCPSTAPGVYPNSCALSQ